MKPETVLDQAALHCESRGRKLTAKRRQVLAGLVKSQKALSAYDLADYCRDKLGTSLLPTSNKYVACAHVTCDGANEIPQFLICQSCGSVKEIGITKSFIQGLSQAVEKVGFHLANNQLELECLCADCVVQQGGVQ